MFRVTPRVLEGTRPLISSLYLPYSIIEGSKLLFRKQLFRTLLARYVLCWHPYLRLLCDYRILYDVRGLELFMESTISHSKVNLWS